MYSLLLLHKAAPSQFLIQLYPFLNQKARLDTPERRNEKRATGKKSAVGTSRAFQRKRHIPPRPPSSSPLLSPRVDQAESWRPLRCCGSSPPPPRADRLDSDPHAPTTPPLSSHLTAPPAPTSSSLSRPVDPAPPPPPSHPPSLASPPRRLPRQPGHGGLSLLPSPPRTRPRP